jgi:hypothetical protein
MRVSKVCAGLFLAGSVIVTGCKSGDKPADTAPPMGGTNGTITTMPTSIPTTTAATMPTTVEVSIPNAIPAVVMPGTMPASAPAVPTPAIVATHIVTKAQPYFESVPTSPTAASAGMFASGTKVLVFSFSGAYAKVTAEDGTTGYTATEGIDPISNK